MTTPTPSQTRKAVQRVFELACKRSACRELAIVDTAQTLCLRVEEVRKHLEPISRPRLAELKAFPP